MIEVRNLTAENISVKRLTVLAQGVLRKEGKGKQELSVALVSPKRMRELNKRYRGKDKTANVLAFPGEEFGLGEIVLCPWAIKKDALQYKISSQKALAWMFVHGLLHLLGYEHKSKKGEQEMARKEQQYLL